MTLVGKIFTVLIFVMSVVFMSFTVAVYATHKNWRDIVMSDDGPQLSLVKQLENKESRNEQLRDQKGRLETELAMQKKASDQVHGELESEYDRLRANHESLVIRQAALLKDQRDAITAVDLAHKTLKDLRKANSDLTANISSAEREKDAALKEMVRLSEENHAAVAESERVKKRQVELSQDLAKAMEVLRKFGLVPVPEKYRDTPPVVEGLVLAVPQQDLIEISIGEDDGLLKGHKLQVVRVQGGRKIYVGRIEVVRTDYDKSVCKIDPNYRQSPVQVNDRVVSRIEQLK